MLPGLIGVIEALEAVKLILGKGDSLVGRLLHFNTLTMEINTLKLRRDPNCPMCGDHPTIQELIDYEEFCSLAPLERRMCWCKCERRLLKPPLFFGVMTRAALRC